MAYFLCWQLSWGTVNTTQIRLLFSVLSFSCLMDLFCFMFIPSSPSPLPFPWSDSLVRLSLWFTWPIAIIVFLNLPVSSLWLLQSVMYTSAILLFSKHGNESLLSFKAKGKQNPKQKAMILYFLKSSIYKFLNLTLHPIQTMYKLFLLSNHFPISPLSRVLLKNLRQSCVMTFVFMCFLSF